MATILVVAILMVVSAGVAFVAALSFMHDRGQDAQRRIQSLENEHRVQQEQYRLLQEQWMQRWRQVEQRYFPITNLDVEARNVQAQILQLQQQHQAIFAQSAQYEQQRQAIVTQYQAAKGVYDRLRSEIGLLEENLEDISYGLYKPHFDFDTSEQFRRELEAVRNRKKEMIRTDRSTQCLVEWTVAGSQAEGKRMQKQLAKLMLRAFNGECDAAIGNCRWNNITRMEERINRAFAAINQLGTTVQVSIVPEYLNLAMQELQLEFELQEKKRAEAEEQRSLKERMREEERAQREFERAEAEALAEENRYSSALARARAEIATAEGQKLTVLSEKVQELQRQLEEAQAKHERAVSMAQLTRRGYVYIISNIGSFGEDMFKIGLTRRLDPMDRIRELGDASVPFSFDVHAMVFCDDAPALEAALHQHFRSRSVNLVNERKEFFRVTLDEIEQFVVERGLQIEITKLAEAREYRETLSLRANSPLDTRRTDQLAFPVELA